MLASRAGRSVRVDPKVLFVYNNFVGHFVEERDNRQGTKGCVAPGLCIKGRNSHEPMDTPFCPQKSKGEPTFHNERRRTNSGFSPISCFLNLCRKSFVFCPPEIHPKDHFRPVTGIGSSGSGVDFAHRVVLIMFAVKQCKEFNLVELILER